MLSTIDQGIFTLQGQGLKLEKIREKALQKGLVTADRTLRAEEWAELIFSPGFSTVDQASDISGRGVGMDAIRASLLNINGHIDLVLQNPDAESLAAQKVIFRLSFPALR